MARSIWKNPFSKKFLFKYVFLHKKIKEQEPILIKSKDYFIFPSFVGFIFSIHDGKNFIYIKIFENMVGHKFGEFIISKKKVIHKKKSKLR